MKQQLLKLFTSTIHAYIRLLSPVVTALLKTIIKKAHLVQVSFLIVVSLASISIYTYTRPATPAHAAPSTTLNFQARLLNSSGSIAPDGNYNITFNLYEDATGGSSLWSETWNSGTSQVTIKGGYLSIYLGTHTSFPSLDWSDDKFLTMNVNSDGEMNPRLKLTAVPFAFNSQQLEGRGADEFAQLAPSTIQEVNAVNAALRINQIGAGNLLQLQSDSSDSFVVDKQGNVIASGELSLGGGAILGDSSNATAGNIRWTGTDFEGYNGSAWVSLTSGSGGGPTNAFEQNGNSFGSTAILGTTDSNSLSFITDTVSQLTIDTSGNVDIINGALNTNGITRLTNAGALQNINGLSFASGNLDLNGGNLINGGSITATSFSGNGSALTSLNATNITSGTLNDARLSSNVALLSGLQTYTGLKTFSAGLGLGNTAVANAGNLRWTGSDFEGYDGSQWLSLTGGSSSQTRVVTKPTNEVVNSSTTLQNDDHLFFSVGANEEWTFRFVVSANVAASPDIKFAVTAPAGSVCRVAVVDPEGATSVSGLGCGVSSGLIPGNGANDVYEVVGTVNSSGTAGNVQLQWAQNTSNAAAVTVLAGSYLNANTNAGELGGGGGGGGLEFTQNGNSFGSTAILGTTDSNSLSFITDTVSQLTIDTSGNVDIINGALNTNGITRLTNAGALQNITTLGLSGAITGATAGNTINGLVINSGALSSVTGITFTSGSLNLNNGGITNAGSIAGATTITGSGNINTTGGAFQTNSVTRLTNAGALQNITTLGLSGAITGATAGNTINGLVINSGALSSVTGITFTSGSLNLNNGGITNAGSIAGATTITGSGNINTTGGAFQTNSVTRLTNAGALQNITGYDQSSGNFAISGTGTFSTGTGNINLNGDVTAATTIHINDGLTIAGTNGNVNSRLYIEGANTTPTVADLPLSYGTYTFSADGDSDEAAWTFVSDNGTNGLNPANTARAWSHDTDDTTSANVGPTSGQGGSPDGYVYTEASSPAAGGDTFHMTLNQTLNASTHDWDISFYWNQRGDENLATVAVQTNEAGGGWVTRGTYAENGPNVATSGAQVWNLENLNLTSAISNASTEIRLLVTFPATGTTWNNDFGIDTISVNGTPKPATYADNLIEGYNASAVSDVDLLVLRSDVGGSENVKFRIDSDGDVFSDGVNFLGGGADVAENYKNIDGAKPGDVVVFRDDRTVEKSSSVSQKGLAGIVSSYAGLVLDAQVNGVPVALSGRAPVKFSAANGPVERGDYLTSGQDGVAVKATNAGPVIGTAMAAANSDGMVDVFVNLGYYNPMTPGLNGQFAQALADGDGLQMVTTQPQEIQANEQDNSSQDGDFEVLSAVKLQLEGSEDGVALRLGGEENSKLTLFNSGALEVIADNEQIFSISSSDGTDHFSVNTQGGLVNIGSSQPDERAVLLVLDSLAIEGDPTGVNGAQYYNASSDKFRCFQANRWQDCISSVTREIIITNTVDSRVINEQVEELGPQAWVTLDDVTEFRVGTQIMNPSSLEAGCWIEVSDSGEDNSWKPLTSSSDKLMLDSAGLTRTAWIQIDDSLSGEQQLRIMCEGGDGNTKVTTGAIRLEIR